jgi:hypothetical protein
MIGVFFDYHEATGGQQRSDFELSVVVKLAADVVGFGEAVLEFGRGPCDVVEVFLFGGRDIIHIHELTLSPVRLNARTIFVFFRGSALGSSLVEKPLV